MNEQFNKRARVESVYQYRFDPSSWNWNKFGSGSRNLGDLLYLMNGESAFKLSALHPPPEYMLQQESHKGGLETSGKMPARNPADKVHYIVQGLATYPFSDFGTGRSPPQKMGTIGSGEFNNRRLLAFQPSFFSFQGLSERESSTSWS